MEVEEVKKTLENLGFLDEGSPYSLNAIQSAKPIGKFYISVWGRKVDKLLAHLEDYEESFFLIETGDLEVLKQVVKKVEELLVLLEEKRNV